MHSFILNFRQNRRLNRLVQWWLLVWLVCGQATVGLADGSDDIARISVDRVKKLIGRPDTVIIDVRTHRNWWRSSKKIPTAVREDPAKADQWREKYPKDHTLIFYCS